MKQTRADCNGRGGGAGGCSSRTTLPAEAMATAASAPAPNLAWCAYSTGFSYC